MSGTYIVSSSGRLGETMKRIVRSHVMPRDESVTISVGSNQKLLDVCLFGDHYLELVLEMDKTKSDATSKWDVQLLWTGETIPEGYTYLKDLSLPNGNRWHVYYKDLTTPLTEPKVSTDSSSQTRFLTSLSKGVLPLFIGAPTTPHGLAMILTTNIGFSIPETDVMINQVLKEGRLNYSNEIWDLYVVDRNRTQ